MPLMKCFCESLTQDIIKRAEIEIGETEEVKQKALQEFKKRIEDKSDLNPWMDEAFLLKFLRNNKFDVSKAFRQLERYYTFKARHSGTITDLTPSDIKHVLEENNGIILEYRDQNDIGVAFARVGEYDMNKIKTDELLATAFIAVEGCMTTEATQILGYHIVFDFSNLSLFNARFIANPTFLYKFVTLFQDCIPGRIRSFHFINEPFYFGIILNTFKHFLSKKMKKRVHVHGSNLESLHNHITPDILPEELGGKQGPMEELAKKYCAQALSFENYFIEANKYGYKGSTLSKLTK